MRFWKNENRILKSLLEDPEGMKIWDCGFGIGDFEE